MDQEKSADYQKLVADMQKKYTEYTGQSSTSKVSLWAPIVNGKNICQEINLYTYWQGFGYAEKTPRIKYLLVAQDWGNLFRSTENVIAGFLKMNKTSEWISFTKIPKGNGTNQNLFKLFEVLNRDLLKLNDDVFFTNFCLGYRSGNEVGGMTKKILMNDAAEFKRLCDILEPENILGLGKITSECVYETLTGKKFSDIYGKFKYYNNFLDSGQNVFNARCGNVDSKIFALAHCGVMGIHNRSLNKQLADWAKIGNSYLKILKEVCCMKKKRFTGQFSAILSDRRLSSGKFVRNRRILNFSAWNQNSPMILL